MTEYSTTSKLLKPMLHKSNVHEVLNPFTYFSPQNTLNSTPQSKSFQQNISVQLTYLAFCKKALDLEVNGHNKISTERARKYVRVLIHYNIYLLGNKEIKLQTLIDMNKDSLNDNTVSSTEHLETLDYLLGIFESVRIPETPFVMQALFVNKIISA